MLEEVFKGEQKNTFGDRTKTENCDNLDLLNLPAKYLPDANNFKDPKQKLRRFIGTIGDDPHKHPKVVEESHLSHFNPSGDWSSSCLPIQQIEQKQGFRNTGCSDAKQSDRSVVCLFANKNTRCLSEECLCHKTGIEQQDDFLRTPFQRKRISLSLRKLQANETAECIFDKCPRQSSSQENKETLFPFTTTSSGNLKVTSDQVAFETNEFSVLVANRKNTLVNINDTRAENMNKDGDYNKINAIVQQGLGSSLGTILASRLADAPIRKEKESSEYEGKATHEILDPELNLNRLGYTACEAIDWLEVSLPEKKNLYLELYARITNFTNADCKVYIDNEEFNCHLLVLQCYSEVFHTYVAVKKVELPSDKCSPASFAFIYEWMITGDPSYRELNRENVLDIFNAAKYLKIKDLVEQCWAFIDNPDVFSEDTAFLLYIDAKEKNLPEVRELMLPRIEKFFLMLVSSQDWLELDLEDVQNFLQSNYICVNCEMEVFMSAVRWLKHDWETRDKYKTTVLSCVRFGNLAPWQLVDIKRNPDNPEFRDLAKDPEICKMIDDGLAFVIIKYWYGQENDDYQHWNSILALKEPSARNWSGTEKTYFTYREFLIYLDQYRRTQMIEKSKARDKKPGKGNDKLSAKPSNEKTNIVKMPTIDEFLLTRKNTVKKCHHQSCKSMQKWAVCRIERAYLSYKFRCRIPGLSARLREKLPKREIAAQNNPSNLMKKFLNPPNKRLQSRLSDFGLVESKKNFFIPRQDHQAMRIAIPKEFEIKQKGINKNKDLIVRTKNDQRLQNIKRKYITDTSLYYMQHDCVIVIGGADVHRTVGVGKNTGKDIYRLIPPDNVWEYVGELPAPRINHSAVYFHDRIYVVGGTDPREKYSEKKYVVVGTVWSMEPIRRVWFNEGHLNVWRKDFGLVAYGNFMYAIGGQDHEYRVTDSVERYDPERGMWEPVASLKFPRMAMGCAKFDDKIWIGGGMCGPPEEPLEDSVECYNVEANQWTRVRRMRMPRCYTSFFATSDNLYVIGGAGKSKTRGHHTYSIKSIDKWNGVDEIWEKCAEMDIPRHGHTVASLGTQMLVIGGVTTDYLRSLSSVECYCIVRGTWIRGLSTLPICLTGHATVTLPPATAL